MTWKYEIDGFAVQSFYLSEPATLELFGICRDKGLFLCPADFKGANKLTVPFGGRMFLCRFWRPKKDQSGNGYVALDLLDNGKISMDSSDITDKIK